MKLRGLIRSFRPRAGSLKATLAIYFLPISVIPVIIISFYATHVFQKNSNAILMKRATLERDAILAEIETKEATLIAQTNRRARQGAFLRSVRTRERDVIQYALGTFGHRGRTRVYSTGGKFLAGVGEYLGQEVDYISKKALQTVLKNGEFIERYFNPSGKGFVTIVRVLLKDQQRGSLGILEEEHHFGQADLVEIKQRRSVDVVVLDSKFSNVAASFALPEEALKSVSALVFEPGLQQEASPKFVTLGAERYAAFLYPILGNKKEGKHWGYLGLFLSMTSVDTATVELKWAMIYLTLLLVLVASLLIFVFSNRLVRPIVALVAAMKRVKVGRLSQIQDIESTHEIEYLVRSFNDMARNISEAKQALELKLKELHRANNEIKNAQSTLVQTAKMASLGQIVAGVAHELNNPIASIYSNMHHLSEYIGSMKKMFDAYAKTHSLLPEQEREKLEALLDEHEIDYVLKDVEDLSRSCLEGAKRTKDIVLGLRMFSRIDQSTFKPTDIHEGLQSTIKLLAAEFKNRVTIHEEYGELPLIECNPSQMNQVFMNLLSNAIQAIEVKGEVWIHTFVEEKEAIIEIEDSGSGIPPDSLEKVFDPFFTTKKVGEGTGLGLSIAYGLIQKHHGTITVDSKVGVGTRFTITLPIKQPVSIAS